MKRRVSLGLGLLVLAGCAHAPTGTLGPDYFKHNESGYELIYLGDGPERGLGPGWTLDNYVKAPARGGGQAYFVREGEGYGFDRRYDFDGDGVPDHSVPRAVYDLRYTQDDGEGVIWTRSIVLAKPLEGKSPKALARRYVRKVSRVGLPFVHFGEGLPTGVEQPRFEVQVVAEQDDCEVANVPAHRIDFELRGEGQQRRASAVLMKPGYQHSLVANGKTHTYEVVLLAVHVNVPAAFEATAPTFDALLDHLSLARGQRAHSCRLGTPADSAGPGGPATSSGASTPEPEDGDHPSSASEQGGTPE